MIRPYSWGFFLKKNQNNNTCLGGMTVRLRTGKRAFQNERLGLEDLSGYGSICVFWYHIPDAYWVSYWKKQIPIDVRAIADQSCRILHVLQLGGGCLTVVFSVVFPGNCDSDEFCCREGNCILDYERCDGYNDCGDWFDEDNCYGMGLLTRRAALLTRHAGSAPDWARSAPDPLLSSGMWWYFCSRSLHASGPTLHSSHVIEMLLLYIQMSVRPTYAQKGDA